MNEKEKNITSIQAKKAKIRERYKGVDPDQLEIIPARRQTDGLCRGNLTGIQ